MNAQHKMKIFNIYGLILSFFAISGFYGAMHAEEVSGKIVDIHEEKIEQDTALPSSIDRGNGIMGYPKPKDFVGFEEMCKELQKQGITEIHDIGFFINLPKDLHFQAEPELACDKAVLTAEKYGINKIWISYSWRNYGKQMSETDKRPNVLAPEFLEEQYRLIDALAKKNKQYGKNILGLWIDEPWYGVDVNRFDNQLLPFKQFCEKEYHETYNGTAIPRKVNPKDKWWRRFVVFNYCVYENFFKRIWDYAGGRGIQIINRNMYTPLYGESAEPAWMWGIDPYRISKIGDYQILPIRFERMFNYENSIVFYYRFLGKKDFSQGIRGFPCSYFCYELYYHDPLIKVQYDDLIRMSREWLGAKTSADIAVMTYPVGLIGTFSKPRTAFLENDNMFWDTAKTICPADMIDVRDTRFYAQYKLLIAPQHCGYSVPGYVIDSLMKYVNDGGILISFDAKFAIGKRDLTDPEDISERLYGFTFTDEETLINRIRFNNGVTFPEVKGKDKKQKKMRFIDNPNIKVLANNISDNEPVIIERTIGKGKIIYVNLAFAERVKANPDWVNVLKFLLNQNVKFSVSVSSGNVNIQSVVIKNERVMFSLSGDNQDDLLKIDTDQLGLKTKEFQVVSLLENTFLKNTEGGKSWNNEALQKGIPVRVKKENGYENIVIEPIGRKYDDKGFVEKVKTVKDEFDKTAHEARLHPKGLGDSPLRKRIILQKQEDTASNISKVQSNLPNKFIMNIIPPQGANLANEPVIINKKLLGEYIKKNIGAVDLYKEGINDKINTLITDDEIIFTDNFNEKDNRYVFCFDENKVMDIRKTEITNIKTSFYSATINNKGEILIDGLADTPVVNLKGPGGYGVMANSYNQPGTFRWEEQSTVYCKGEFVNSVNDVKFRTVYEFFNGSPYIDITYSSDQNNPERQLEVFAYWPAGELEQRTDDLEFLADSGDKWRKGNEKSWYLPFIDENYILIKRKNTGFAWILLSSTFVNKPYVMIGTKRSGYFNTLFSETQRTPTLINNPKTEFMYVAGVSDKEKLNKILNGLKGSWTVQIQTGPDKR